MMGFVEGLPARERGALGTWVKIPSMETVELLAHAGFDFVVVDLEHAPLSLETAYRLVFTAQAMGMAAFVRLSDRQGSQIQRLLDGGADGLLVPQISDIETAERLTRQMVFAPQGERGLGATSRAGRWGQLPIEDYIRRGDEQCLRMVQLEDWETLARSADYLALPFVTGVFVGLGDLFLSSGRKPDEPEVLEMAARVAAEARAAGKASGVAVGRAQDAQAFLDMGYSMVMVSNDASIFGNGAKALAAASRGNGV